jgi:actin-like ATPase involved in cell morphogenesis
MSIDQGGPKSHALGIDFGTSNTVAVGRWPDGRARPILVDGSPLLPSAVYVEADGQLAAGRDAVYSARLDPARFEPNPKRRVDDGLVLLGDREIPVTDLIAAVLERVAEEWRRTVGPVPTEVTLTCPATWGATRRGLLAEAAARAGLDGGVSGAGAGGPRLVAEPVAAATYFAEVLGRDVPIGSVVVVHDFGAGTFDVSVVARTAEGFEVLAVDGRDDIGGLDVDAAVVEYLQAQHADAAWQRITEPANVEERRAQRQLWDDVRVAKERLSRSQSADLVVPLLNLEIHLTRDELESVARPVLEQTVQVTRRLLRWADLPEGRLAGVFLVGGASRIPLVATLLHRELGEAPVVIEQPELVVAEGSILADAALLAAGPAAPGPTAELRLIFARRNESETVVAARLPGYGAGAASEAAALAGFAGTAETAVSAGPGTARALESSPAVPVRAFTESPQQSAPPSAEPASAAGSPGVSEPSASSSSSGAATAGQPESFAAGAAGLTTVVSSSGGAGEQSGTSGASAPNVPANGAGVATADAPQSGGGPDAGRSLGAGSSGEASSGANPSGANSAGANSAGANSAGANSAGADSASVGSAGAASSGAVSSGAGLPGSSGAGSPGTPSRRSRRRSSVDDQTTVRSRRDGSELPPAVDPWPHAAPEQWTPDPDQTVADEPSWRPDTPSWEPASSAPTSPATGSGRSGPQTGSARSGSPTGSGRSGPVTGSARPISPGGPGRVASSTASATRPLSPARPTVPNPRRDTQDPPRHPGRGAQPGPSGARTAAARPAAARPPSARPSAARPSARPRPRRRGRFLRFLQIMLSVIVLITVPMAAMIFAYSYGTGEPFQDAAVQLARELRNLYDSHIA